MRVLILAITLIAMAAPAFANCGSNHEAASSGTSTVATTGTPDNPAPPPGSGG